MTNSTRQYHQRRPPLPPAGSRLDAWDGAVRDFTEHLHRVGQPGSATIDAYAKRVRCIAADLPRGPWKVTGSQVAYALDGRNWSAHTRRQTLIALRRFYKWAILAGRVERSPLAGIPDALPQRPGPLRQQPPAAWRKPVADHLTAMAASGRRRETIGLRRSHLLTFSHTFADPWKVTTDDVAAYLSRDDWSAEYRRSTLGSIRAFYKWAILTDRARRDPTLPLAPVSVPRSLPRPAPDDVVTSSYASASDRVRLALDLGVYAGLRRAEVACLQESDILDGQLRVTGKGGHQRLVPIVPALATALTAARYAREQAGESSPWLFPSPRGGHISARWLGHLVGQAMPTGWTMHTLRHRFATQAYSSTRDLRATQELLGHTKPETTMRYTQVPTDALVAALANVGRPVDTHATSVRGGTGHVR